MHRLKQLTLFLGDVALLYLGIYAAVALRFLEWPSQKLVELIAPMTQLFLLAALIMFIVGLYDIGRARNSRAFFEKLGISAAIWLVLGIVYFYINPRPNVTPKTILLFTAVIGFSLVGIWRYFYNRFLSTVIWKTTIVFAGITPEVLELAEKINREPELGYRIIGIIADENAASIPPAIPSANTLNALVQKNGQMPELIIMAPKMLTDKILLGDLYKAIFQQASIVELAVFFEGLLKRVPPFTFSESWFVAHLHEQQKKIYDRLRILIDYAVAVILGILTFVTVPFVAIAIKLNSNGPVFFKQKRVGRGGQIFTIYKYRTMRALSADGSAELSGAQYAASNDSRITGVGKFLRRTRLDEFPQFVNILKGEMALIGPRPERPEFVAELTAKMPFYALRHLIKPGITGWAQIQRSYYGNIEENLFKLEYDLYYVKNRGPLMDLGILLKTINIISRMMGR